MTILLGLLAVVLAVTAAFVTSLWLTTRAQLAHYSPILDVEVECARVRQERDTLAAEIPDLKSRLEQERAACDHHVATVRADLEREVQSRRSAVEQEVTALRALVSDQVTMQRKALTDEITTKRGRWEADYGEAIAELDTLTRQVEAFRTEAELQSFGVYHPVYDFDTPEQFKDALKEIRAQQAALLKSKSAAVCQTEWTIDGSKAMGRTMTDRNLKLMLRAFNGEADAAVVRVRFDNITQMLERLTKSFDAINKLGEPNRCAIVRDYLDLKLAELRLTHELAERIQTDKETQRQLREQMRDEEKAQRELEKAQKDAERDELAYQKALDKARAELEAANAALQLESEAKRAASEAKQGVLADKIAELEARLAEAHENKDRAVSLAQQTRTGHVYVISNQGSFGEHVYKIGMTRRLDPMDRVKELGDASVPFLFDVHAIIRSEDAPALEAALHRQLGDRRVNLVNERKEFFRVTLDEIEALVRTHHGAHVEFQHLVEAEEFRKSLALRAERQALAAAAPLETADKAVDEAKRHFQDARRRLQEATLE